MSPLYCWAMLRGEAKQVSKWSPIRLNICVLFCVLPNLRTCIQSGEQQVRSFM